MYIENRHISREDPLCVCSKMNINSLVLRTSNHLLKISSRLKKMLVKLKLFKKASVKVRKKILKNCNKTLLCFIRECAKNVLKGKVPLSNPQKSRLSRFKKKLRHLASKKTLVKVKKKIVQSGGFLGVLLTPVLSFLGLLLLNNNA